MERPPEKYVPEKHRTPKMPGVSEPLPERTARPRDQITQAINDMSLEALNHLGELLSLFEEVIKGIKAEDDRLKRETTEHSIWCQQVIDCKKVINDGVEHLRNGRLLTAQVTEAVNSATKLLDEQRGTGNGTGLRASA